MLLIAGLGNPGSSFTRTRHNIGFEILDSLHSEHKFGKFSEKFDGLFSKTQIFDQNVILFKPMKYMNLSGLPLYKIINFYNIDYENNLIVIHDDLDMDFSKIKIKSSGGHGGHNGVRNIIDYIGNKFYRIKIGIKNKKIIDKKKVPTKFVLENFEKSEIKKINMIKKFFVNNFQLIVEKKFSLIENKP